MRRLLIPLLLLAMGCATGPRRFIDASHKPPLEQQQDRVACQALAAQSSLGAGAWSTDPAIRAGVQANVRDQAMVQCLESKGWTWKTGY